MGRYLSVLLSENRMLCFMGSCRAGDGIVRVLSREIAWYAHEKGGTASPRAAPNKLPVFYYLPAMKSMITINFSVSAPLNDTIAPLKLALVSRFSALANFSIGCACERRMVLPIYHGHEIACIEQTKPSWDIITARY